MSVPAHGPQGTTLPDLDKSLTAKRSLHVATAFVTDRWATPGMPSPKSAPPHVSPTSAGIELPAPGPPVRTQPASLGIRGRRLSADLNGTSQRFDLEGRVPPSSLPLPTPKGCSLQRTQLHRRQSGSPNSALDSPWALHPSSCKANQIRRC